MEKKESYGKIKFKISPPTWNENLNYQMDHFCVRYSEIF